LFYEIERKRRERSDALTDLRQMSILRVSVASLFGSEGWALFLKQFKALEAQAGIKTAQQDDTEKNQQDLFRKLKQLGAKTRHE
jgi:hypothetical protein